MHCLAVVWVGGDGCYASRQQTQGSVSAVGVSIVSLSYHELPFASSASLTASSTHLRKEDRKTEGYIECEFNRLVFTYTVWFTHGNALEYGVWS